MSKGTMVGTPPIILNSNTTDAETKITRLTSDVPRRLKATAAAIPPIVARASFSYYKTTLSKTQAGGVLK